VDYPLCVRSLTSLRQAGLYTKLWASCLCLSFQLCHTSQVVWAGTGEDETRMFDAFLSNFALLDPSAYVVIAVIALILGLSLLATFTLRRRYLVLSRELRRSHEADFRSRVLVDIVRDTLVALERGAAEINTQAIIEHHFHTRLRALIVAERFIKASTGLLIILGLVGTFYGLTIAIGRLVKLVATDATGGGSADLALTLTQGLTQALAGMSVAFTVSLFGIVSAIIMTLVSVFWNVTDRRVGLMVEIEAFLDNHLSRSPHATRDGIDPTAFTLQQFGQALTVSVNQLQQAMAQFDSSLSQFAGSTREFQQFNMHLKDNIQRLSLVFADLSDTLNAHVTELQRRERPRA